ncbi:hypothetical protein ES703_87717 [subsurface metagenome]
MPGSYGIGKAIPDGNLHGGLGVGGDNIFPPVLASLPLGKDAGFTCLTAIDITKDIDNLNHRSISSFL